MRLTSLLFAAATGAALLLAAPAAGAAPKPAADPRASSPPVSRKCSGGQGVVRDGTGRTRRTWQSRTCVESAEWTTTEVSGTRPGGAVRHPAPAPGAGPDWEMATGPDPEGDDLPGAGVDVPR